MFTLKIKVSLTWLLASKVTNNFLKSTKTSQFIFSNGFSGISPNERKILFDYSGEILLNISKFYSKIFRNIPFSIICY